MKRLAHVRGWLRWLLKPGSRLSERALHATVWAFGSKGFERLLDTARALVLARLLTPKDFGFMGVGLVAVAFLDTLTKPGFSEALVQKKGNIDRYLNTFWTVGVTRALIVAVALAASAPLLASFFGAPDARLILQVMAIAVLARSLSNPGVLYFQKDLEFHKKALVELLPTAVEMGVAIVVGVMTRNAWALVIGYSAGAGAQVLVSYWAHPYRPRLQRRLTQARELFTFGRWVYLERVLNFVSTQADSVVLGRLLGPANLGFYQMAQRTSKIPLQEVPRAFASVAFPVYARLQDEPAKLRRAFLMTVEVVTSTTVPLAVVICLMGRDFVALALGERWLGSVGAIQILAVAGAVAALTSTGGSLFLAVGKPWLSLQMNALRAVALAAGAFPLIHHFGLRGAGYAVLASSLASFVFYLVVSQGVLRIPAGAMARSLLPAATLGLAAAAATAVGREVFPAGEVAGFLAITALIFVSYAFVHVILWWRFKAGLLGSLAAARLSRRSVGAGAAG